ncbi:hypothetical protein MTF65_09575 [Streptomyces sp. APSN-46.1]|uniref:hypothetical protein n=1 Tax=Streptomyces sp. APSN-46.1 TaxID=2929049 RepID=UPI001FB2325C|nr:hypothetical protein [Streptomyces sp. APSN-46.1]MCJ1677581.1 hypothetical protein [Streptomyces sp. APSN-46.1]
MTGRPVPGPMAGGEWHTIDHPLTGEHVRDIANGLTGTLTCVTAEHHAGRLLEIAHIRSTGGGIEWTTAASNISPVGGAQ